MATLTIDCNHIDTCLACYLTDHHNRDGEYLLGVPVDGATTYADVLQGLLDEANSCVDCDDERLTDAAIEAAIEACFADVADMSAVFDDSLEINESDHDWDEPVSAWFLLHMVD